MIQMLNQFNLIDLQIERFAWFSLAQLQFFDFFFNFAFLVTINFFNCYYENSFFVLYIFQMECQELNENILLLHLLLDLLLSLLLNSLLYSNIFLNELFSVIFLIDYKWIYMLSILFIIFVLIIIYVMVFVFVFISCFFIFNDVISGVAHHLV